MRANIASILLAPFALLYGIGILLRNGLYHKGLLKSTSFDLPVIGVGNLTLGGAGKTPHVEYLIRLLSPYLKVGVLSRGYKRETKGFHIVRPGDTSKEVGDEPLQYFLKYKDIIVAVSESRSLGIPMMLTADPHIQSIILDDSYQHLSVRPGLHILLTEYSRPYTEDSLLPMGRLREWASGADRADIIIVTKCPDDLDVTEMDMMRTRLDLEVRQRLYFSKYTYGPLYHLIDGSRHLLRSFDRVILLTAIANEAYLLSYIEKEVPEVHPMSYEDHHWYTPHEMSVIKQHYDHLSDRSSVIVTTEKDATRLILHRAYIIEHRLPIMVLPLKVTFLADQGAQFDQEIKDFLIQFRV